MLKSLFSSSISIPVLRLSGIIGQAGFMRNGLNIHSLDKVINKKSTTWRQLDGKLKERINSHFQDILLQFPTLIKRPFWEVDFNAIDDLEPGFKQNQKDYLEKLKN